MSIHHYQNTDNTLSYFRFRYTIVSENTVFLLPFLPYACYLFCYCPVTSIDIFLVIGYNIGLCNQTFKSY